MLGVSGNPKLGKNYDDLLNAEENELENFSFDEANWLD
jgi:hypothetical protein